MPNDPLLPQRLISWVWSAWALYWLVAAYGNKATRRREPFASRLIYMLALVAGSVLIAWDRWPWGRALDEFFWPRSALSYLVGLAVLIVGLAFSVWARVHLGRNWSGTVTVKEDHELIRTGPYRYVRHPIYTGILTGAMGTAICSGTLRAALGLAIVAAAFIVKLRAEERFMRETFPGQYEKYSEEVPALVPFTKLPRSAPR
ncbi:MAG TPA: isoprenylcysteine carboxylmethyltransferase family protein [Steroidobacteraceae bacterium]|nr:isoprenylcysteine carboxylmethyltransferase family protein [Steroidobacteraceae bacterium]